MLELRPDLVVDARNQLGEGPVWDHLTESILWVDILAGEVHRYDPTGGVTAVTPIGQEVGALVPRNAGGLVLAVRDGFAALDDEGTVTPLAAVEATDPSTRMNDGKCDRHGRFWASTMAFDASPERGSLYRLDANGTVEQMLTGLTIGNGLAWSADDRTFYFIDSMTGGVDAFDFDLATGRLNNRRQVVKVAACVGIADGMCIDGEGSLWVALYGGGAVHRYAADGELTAVVSLPVPNVTCCTFGGADLRDLYITTAWNGMSEQDRTDLPEAGGLYRAHTDVPGVLPYPFAG